MLRRKVERRALAPAFSSIVHTAAAPSVLGMLWRSAPRQAGTRRGLGVGEFPSGQRGQTVNLMVLPSQVRILLPPPFPSLPFEASFLKLAGQ